MKALIKFLLNTGTGRMIVQMIFGLAIRLFKKKVLQRMEPYKREALEKALELADMELHADLESGNVKVTDLI